MFLSSTTFAQSLKDKVIFSPYISYLWNFQRGVEELYRFVKFTSVMRIGYSLDLSDRRIGEMEVLISKNKSNIIPMVENVYELEIDKIQSEMNSTDIFSSIITQASIKTNVTQRLEYEVEILNGIAQNATESKDYIESAVKKTSSCLDSIK